MDDKQFINAYNEVILENMNSVLKQNFIFQTQLKFVEDKDKEIGELKEQLAKFQDLEKNISESKSQTEQRVVDLQSEVNNLKHQISAKDEELKKNSNNDADRHRLQTAVNSQAKEIETLKSQMSNLEAQKNKAVDENNQHTEYIKQLEDMLPKTKKKQLGITEETTQENNQPENKIEDLFKMASTGGTF